MLYTYLGKLVWKAAKRFLRRKYGRALVPKPVLLVVGAATLAGVGLALGRRDSPAA